MKETVSENSTELPVEVRHSFRCWTAILAQLSVESSTIPRGEKRCADVHSLGSGCDQNASRATRPINLIVCELSASDGSITPVSVIVYEKLMNGYIYIDWSPSSVK